MNLINATLTLAQDELNTSRLMGQVVGGIVILIVVILIFKAVKGKKK